jgi:hypothetical protein
MAFRKPTSIAVYEQGAYQFRKEIPKQRLSEKIERRTAAEPSPVRDSAARAQSKCLF